MAESREWLEKFINLCDTGASTLEFRRHCRVKAQHLPRHVRKLDLYRAKLAAFQAADAEKERQEKIKQRRLRALEEARRVRAEQAADRLAALREQESNREDDERDAPDVEDNS
jgi:hypothetical protein